MSNDQNRPGEKPADDPRVAGIATVGWTTLAALGLCIPLMLVMAPYSKWLAAVFPLAVLVGAGIMATRVWATGEQLVHKKENEALRKRLSDVEERLANLEMVDSLEAHFAQKHAGESPLPRPVAGDEDPSAGDPLPESTTN